MRAVKGNLGHSPRERQRELEGHAQRAQWESHHRTTYTSKLGRTTCNRSLQPCLVQGASRRARVGRVRSLNFLSILRESFFVVAHVMCGYSKFSCVEIIFCYLLDLRDWRRGSSTRLSVAAGAEWVRAPIEMRFGPASAIARMFFNVIPPDTSTTACPLINRMA